MPRIIDYRRVVQVMGDQGFVSLYYNSGAFGFASDVPTRSVGWVSGEDSSIRAEARKLTRRVAEPAAVSLAGAAVRAWTERLAGPVWLTPKSHWAYELDFGNHSWLPAALEAAGLSPDQVSDLAGRHDGTAIEFAVEEVGRVQGLLVAFFHQLFGSDFLLTWPGGPAVCTVHHHKQLWWTTTDESLMATLETIVPSDGGGRVGGAG